MTDIRLTNYNMASARLIGALLLCASAQAAAQNSASLSPYDSAGNADFEYACAEEIRQVNAATPGMSTFGYWKEQFKDWSAPGTSFERIRTENRPQFIPAHYLAACASLTYMVQRKSGVGSGQEALAQWRELRARFDKPLAGGTTSTTPDSTARPATGARGGSTPARQPTASAGPAANSGAGSDNRTERREVRPGCSVMVFPGSKVYSYTGGSCTTGLLEGFVRSVAKDAWILAKYEKGRSVRNVAMIVAEGGNRSWEFQTRQIDENNKSKDLAYCWGESASERANSSPPFVHDWRSAGRHGRENSRTHGLGTQRSTV